MHLLRNRSLIQLSLAHLFVDLFSSVVPVLLAFYSVPMALTNAQLATAASIYTFVSSLLQPAFGWLTDRFGSRWLGAGGLLWCMVFMSLVVVVGEQGSYLLLVGALGMAALGSAAFHPQGAMNATHVEERHRTTSASIFFFFGNIGLTIGPLLTGVILRDFGPSTFPLVVLTGLPVVWLTATSVPMAEQHQYQSGDGRHMVSASSRMPLALGVVAPLVALIALRSWANFGTVTFLPKFYQDQGWDPASYGVVASLWTLGTAVGNVSGGPLADRYGRRLLVSLSLFTMVPVMVLLPFAQGGLPFPLIVLGGFTSGLSFSVIMVLAQTLLPGGKGMASGFTMGFMFASGALGNVINGWLADWFGLAISLQAIALVAFGAAVCARFLPRTRPTEHDSQKQPAQGA
jgi:MFS transporter, FSR family, fosmidomycin resistance protein